LTKDRFAITEGGVQRTVIAFSEVRDEAPNGGVLYRIEFESVDADSRLQVVLNPPRGLPPLTITWK